MTKNLSILERCRSKQRYLATYVALADGWADRWSLLKLAWGRFDVYKAGREGSSRPWSARLDRLKGGSVSLRLDDVQHLAIFDELFLHSAYDLTLVPFIPDLILDVGAHIGLFSLLAGSHWPDTPILAFEPHPENAAWARRNTAGNGLRAAVMEAAVSSKSGWMKFNAGGGMGNLSAQGDLTVPAIDLPALMRTIPSKRTLLKMDIEGEELNLLPHVLPALPETCAAFVEIHGRSAECAALMEKIRALGFAHRQVGEKRSADGHWHFIDLFLTRL